MNNIENWRVARAELKSIAYDREFERVVSELHTLERAVLRMDCIDEYEQKGIASLIITVANKVSDLAHGRTTAETLPE